MSRKVKRSLSLVLALIMICSTLGVMAFAQERASLYAKCGSVECNNDYRHFTRHYSEFFNRVTGCPAHYDGHDAEEWYLTEWYTCDTCGWAGYYSSRIEYRCL